MKNNPEKEKKAFIKKYKKLINALENSSLDIQSLEAKNSSFGKIQKHIAETLSSQAQKVEAELDNAINTVEWDRLVIAFFGETGAGKSTTIETFRILLNEETRVKGNDGAIVGDGTSDFTKDYNEYQMSFNGKPITLIDVPGIEGNEDEFREGIKKALNKAHCVFYVCNEKPNSATTMKIKEYLRDWVSVYSIYNIRGYASGYDREEDRKTLLKDPIRKTSAVIEEAFKEMLGNIYMGNLPVHSLLAMCSLAEFTEQRPDLIKKQDNFKKIFGGAESMFEFSLFPNLEKVLEDKSEHYIEGIVDANTSKLLSLTRESVKELRSTISSEKEAIEKFQSDLKSFKRSVSYIFSSTKNSLYEAVISEYDKMFNGIRDDGYKILDKYSGDKQKLKEELDETVKERAKVFSDELENIIRQKLEKLRQNIDSKRKSLDFYLEYDYDLNVVRFNDLGVNYGSFLDEFDVSFGDFVSFALDVGNFASAGAFFGPWGALAGALLGAVIHAANSDGGLADAKKKFRTEIDKAKNKGLKKIEESINQVKGTLDDFKVCTVETIKGDIDSLDNLKQIVSLYEQKAAGLINEFNGNSLESLKLENDNSFESDSDLIKKKVAEIIGLLLER